MTNVKLYYFDIKGLAEPIRLLLTHLGVDFEDVRIKREDWPALKEKMPFGTMPVLVVNGKQYAQSIAIGRYLGHKYGLAGKTNEEDFEIDQNIDFVIDIRINAMGVFIETDEAKKKEKHEALMKDYYPVVFAKLNDILLKNNGHIALGRLTWADFYLGTLLVAFKSFPQMPDIEEKYPGFKKSIQVLLSNPKVKAFSEKHIKSNMAKLYYFDTKGLAEPIRLLLTHLGVDFEDVRIKKEDWPALKGKMPFGTMPVLEMNGKQYAQSAAIGRYLGHKYGLAGKNVEEDFEIDQNLDYVNDIRIKALGVLYENDEARKKEKHEALMKDYYPGAFSKLNEILLQNNGHLALGRLTWADFYVGGMIDGFKMLTQMPDIDEKYPGLKKSLEVLESNPKVKAFIEKHKN
ncbi:glutathione S-transferase 1-like [Aricia agestis]|uniref:glutathione S-transferase 1-like n=1 Tax=Aricia agestis TaxID=91739 RepID=UPI001C209473|nr:glutathione S-transferase 1-like [Aricia agestis]